MANYEMLHRNNLEGYCKQSDLRQLDSIKQNKIYFMQIIVSEFVVFVASARVYRCSRWYDFSESLRLFFRVIVP
jgi:hypothetical protein